MKRNWDIIRDNLLSLEAANTPSTYLRSDHLPQHPEQEVAYNMRLLDEAGYVNGKFLPSSSGDGKINAAIVMHMTNAGHDLLDTIRNQAVWDKVKEAFKTKGLDMTFDLVIAVGKKVMEAMLS